MSNSTARRPRLGGGRSTVTVIEDRVHRSSARNAKAAFWLTLTVVTAVAMVIASASMHPILAALLGLAIGTAAAALVCALVRIWPVLRLIWWWLPEIALTVTVTWAWMQLASHTPLWVRAVVVGLVLALAAIRPVRRCLAGYAWCLIDRHRLRVCFAQFIVANRSGSLPLIGLARPTPVGERVWIYLRPGLSHADLTARLEKIAVACHAKAVLVEQASDRTAAWLRIDIKRRQVLATDIGSPLVEHIDPQAPQLHPVQDVPTALDLPDVADTPTAGKPASVVKTPFTRGPGKPSPVPATTPARSSAVNGSPNGSSANGSTADVEDINDWI